MDPVTLIVTALALGAAAGLESTAEQVVKDAYSGLKNLIGNRYQAAKTGVDLIENNPKSETFKDTAKELLQTTEASQDEELLHRAQALTELVQKYAPKTAADINVSVSDIEAIGNFRVSGLEAHGGQAKVDVDLKKLKVSGDIEISGLRADARQDTDPKA